MRGYTARILAFVLEDLVNNGKLNANNLNTSTIEATIKAIDTNRLSNLLDTI
jgi:hypothetical protein